MESDLTWHDIAADYGVLELHERLTAPRLALELHVVVCPGGAATLAWWETDEGELLGEAFVGSA